jgi:hypothetical protein
MSILVSCLLSIGVGGMRASSYPETLLEMAAASEAGMDGMEAAAAVEAERNRGSKLIVSMINRN